LKNDQPVSLWYPLPPVGSEPTISACDRIPKRVLSMKLEATRPRGRPRNRWQDEVSEDGRLVGGEE
jgi:hypothetical protein